MNSCANFHTVVLYNTALNYPHEALYSPSLVGFAKENSSNKYSTPTPDMHIPPNYLAKSINSFQISIYHHFRPRKLMFSDLLSKNYFPYDHQTNPPSTKNTTTSCTNKSPSCESPSSPFPFPFPLLLPSLPPSKS